MAATLWIVAPKENTSDSLATCGLVFSALFFALAKGLLSLVASKASWAS